MKYLCLLIIFILVNISLTMNTNTVTEDKVRMMRKKKYSQRTLFKQLVTGKLKTDSTLKLPKGPLFWEGWIKYFHYNTGEKLSKPRHFFINEQFYHQTALKDEMKQKDNHGPLKIPTMFHFYGRLMKNAFNIIYSRENDFMRNTDSLNIDIIKPVPEDSRYKGGISDLGNFEEGKCIQVSTTVPVNFSEDYYSGKDKGFTEHWIICTDSESEKAKLLGTLVNLRILKQKSLGYYENTKKPPSKKKTMAAALKDIHKRKIKKLPNSTPKDGYWIMLSDWSQCTLKCGGGLRYQQWMCVPPKKGGRPCKGKAIKTKPCNSQKCPQTMSNNVLGDKKDQTVLKPEYKIIPFTSRPQRYIKCQIKESDVLYKTYDSNGDETKMPSRIVMNNRTITLYEDETYHKQVFTFNLPQVSFFKSKNDHCCFVLRSLNQQYEICGFNTNCGTKEKPVFYRSWESDFFLWQTKCFVSLNDKEWDEKVKRDWDNKLAAANLDLIDEKAKLLKEKLKNFQNIKIERKIKSTHTTVMSALQKEARLEQLLAKEEKEKFERQTRMLLKTIKREKKKKACLIKVLKSREKEDERKRKAKEAVVQVNKLKEDAKKQVNQNRKRLRKKLEQIRKKARRRNRLLQQKLQKIRGSMAQELLNANKFGDKLLCKSNRGDKMKMQKYCDSNFLDNYAKNQDCKNPDDFCYVCCENEFGNMYIKERDNCYDMCDALAKADLNNGEWVWEEENESKKK